MLEEHQTPSESATFIQCTFIKLTYTYSGGAISFTSEGYHTVRDCFFRECSTINYRDWHSGGGAVSCSAGSLSVYSSVFINCRTVGFGGAILGTSNCASMIVSNSLIIACSSKSCGGGVSAHNSSAAHLSCCCFISCESPLSGGGYYHYNEAGLSLRVSNSLFRKNTANMTESNRGGGGLEDCRITTYNSQHFFIFFSDNSAQNGVGNDLSICVNPLSGNDIAHCFTTTSSDSFWNNGRDFNNWLITSLVLSKISNLNNSTSRRYNKNYCFSS